MLMETIVIDFWLKTFAQFMWYTVTQHFALVTSLLSRASSEARFDFKSYFVVGISPPIGTFSIVCLYSA